MRVLREQGFNVFGYEPSLPKATEFVANNKAEITGRFHGIFSNNVIEHFRDPVAEFRYFHQILEEKGQMVHTSPCYDYKYSFTRFHTLFLLGRSPFLLAEKTGFTAKPLSFNDSTMSFIYEKRT
jgi:hypothetical protein